MGTKSEVASRHQTLFKLFYWGKLWISPRKIMRKEICSINKKKKKEGYDKFVFKKC